MADLRRCTAKTRKGKPCKNWPVHGADKCASHLRTPKAARGGQVAPASRPAEITEDRTAALEKLLRAGNYITTACAVIGLPYSTYKEWMAKGSRSEPKYTPYRIFAQRVEAALAHGESRLVLKVQKGTDADWRAAAWILERQHPEHWAKVNQRAPSEDEPPDGGGDDGEPSLRMIFARVSQLGGPAGQG